jgi:hypothetical protein
MAVSPHSSFVALKLKPQYIRWPSQRPWITQHARSSIPERHPALSASWVYLLGGTLFSILFPIGYAGEYPLDQACAYLHLRHAILILIPSLPYPPVAFTFAFFGTSS